MSWVYKVVGVVIIIVAMRQLIYVEVCYVELTWYTCCVEQEVLLRVRSKVLRLGERKTDIKINVRRNINIQACYIKRQ